MLLVYPLNNENLYLFIYKMLALQQYNISTIQKYKNLQVAIISLDRLYLNRRQFGFTPDYQVALLSEDDLLVSKVCMSRFNWQ